MFAINKVSDYHVNTHNRFEQLSHIITLVNIVLFYAIIAE